MGMSSVILNSKYVQTTSFPLNRWGIPKFLFPRGGGENDVSVPVNSFAWENKLQRQNQWLNINNQMTMSVEQSSNNNKNGRGNGQSAAAGQNKSPSGGNGMQNTPAQNTNGGSSSWAQVAGKGLPSGGIPTDEEKLQSMKEALLSTDGWGGENVNQDSAWDLPPSPEPSKDQCHPKAPVNDGCELWKNAKIGDASSGTNSNAWNQPSTTSEKPDSNNWFGYAPMSQNWRPHPNDNQNQMWTGPHASNTPSNEDTSTEWQAPKTTSVATTHNMVSQSAPGMINPSPYPLGPFAHMDAQNLPPGNQTVGSGLNAVPPHKLPNTHVLMDQQGNSNNSKETRNPAWEGMASVPKEPPSSWGAPAPQPMGHPKWIGLPNHALPERHLVTSSNQAPIMAPPLPHGLIKPDQIMWSQINPGGGDFHHDVMPGGWGNNSLPGTGPPNYKNNTSMPEPNNDDFDLSGMDALKKMSQENSQPVPTYVNQIQLAVQAGFLNPQILHQPLAPNSLILLNQMLSSVSFLHKLVQQQNLVQPQMHLNKNAHQQFMQLNIHINKTKQQIQHLQNQISNHQDLYMKQHQSPHILRPSQPGVGMGNNDYKNNLPDQFLLNFNQMNIRDSSAPIRSQMANDSNKWKLSGNSYSNMRDHLKVKPHGSANHLLLPSDSSWSQSKSLEHGWAPHMANRHGVPTPPSNDQSHGPSHDSWSSGHQPIQPFDLDIKPFEPGKPWMMKNLEDGFDFSGATSANRAPLGFNNEILGTTKGTSSSGADTLSSLPLNSSTWSFNPTSQNNANDVKIAPQNMRAKESWSDGSRPAAPLGSDLWPPHGNKNPSTNQSSKPSQSWGAIGRSTSWAGPSRTTPSALPQGQPWTNAHTTWLILKNLTPEIDGATLKTLCMQHGPLVTFHLYLNHGFALVNYGTQEEAVSAQGSLNNCLLSNTTILAEFAAEAEVNALLGSGRGTTPTSQPSKNDWGSGVWNPGTNSALWSGSYDGDHRSTPLKSYLPDGLLNSETL